MVRPREFRAARVYQTVTTNLSNPRQNGFQELPPPWLPVVELIPPSGILTRTVPVRHQTPNPRMKKPSRTFHPQKIVYEEDELRRVFFKDHPWELARPRMMVELDGKDSRRVDWSRGLRQPGMPLSGECVVQRQLWLMHAVPGITKDQAYDQVRKEFYRLRQEEEIERRVALEEARMVGAYFGKNRIQIGMGVEDIQFEKWKKWAESERDKAAVERAQAVSSFGNTEEPEDELAAQAEKQGGLNTEGSLGSSSMDGGPRSSL